jgi:hypothetical protein
MCIFCDISVASLCIFCASTIRVTCFFSIVCMTANKSSLTCT